MEMGGELSIDMPQTAARSEKGGLYGYIGAALLCVAGGLLTAAVMQGSFAAYFADADPKKALVLNSWQSNALLNEADRALLKRAAEKQAAAAAAVSPAGGTRIATFSKLAKEAMGSVEAPAGATARAAPEAGVPDLSPAAEKAWIETIRGYAMKALAVTPLNARALRILGQLAELEDDTEKAAKFMSAAAHVSFRETYAVYWLMLRSNEQKDIPETLRYADILLRTRAGIIPLVTPVLAGIAGTGQGATGLKQLLSGNPPWRMHFFAELATSASNPSTPLDLMLAIKDSPHPPTNVELKNLFDALLARNQHELAYYAWLQFLPPEQLATIGLLFNGSFEIPPTDFPFDWRIPNGVGATAQITARIDRPLERGLRIDLGQTRATFPGVSQLLMLPPGPYRFSGSYMGELIGRRGLEWKVTCVSRPSVILGASRMFTGISPSWSEFDYTFQVPAEDCRAQTVQLFLASRSESEKLLSGVAWFDDLRISRVSEPAASAPSKP